MKNFSWDEFHDRYVNNGEEFGFFYKNKYSLYFSNDQDMNAIITLAIYDHISRDNIEEMLYIFGYQDVSYKTATVFESKLMEKQAISWEKHDFNENQIIQKLLKDNCRFIVNLENSPFEIYRYKNNQDAIVCAISRKFSTRNSLLDETRIDGMKINQLFKNLD